MIRMCQGKSNIKQTKAISKLAVTMVYLTAKITRSTKTKVKLTEEMAMPGGVRVHVTED